MRQITSRIRRSTSNTTLANSPRPSRTIRRRAVLAAALIGCGAANVAMAQTSGSWIGGVAGSWSTPGNWAITSGAGAYPDGGGVARFSTATATATAITLDTGITLSSLDDSLAGGAFTINGANTVSFTGAATIVSPIAKTLTFGAPVVTGLGTLTDGGNAGGTVAFNVGFTGNYVQNSFNASGIATLQNTNTFGAFSGSVTVNGGTFNLNTNGSAGSNGTFGANTTVTINAGSIQVLNGSTAVGETQAKINNRFVSTDSTTINGGTLQFFGTSATVGGVNTAMGQLTVFGGSGAFGIQTSNADNNTRIKVTNFLRNSNGALLLRGEGLGQFGTYDSPTAGQKASFLKISDPTNEQNFMANNLVGSPATTYTSYTAAASTATDLPIVPWMTGDLNGNASTVGIGYSTSFVTYMADSSGAGPGFVVLGPTNFLNTAPDGTKPTSNYSLTGAVTLNSDTTVNSLILNDNGGVSGPGALTITSGALAAFKNASAVTVSNALHFGASDTREAVIDTGSISVGSPAVSTPCAITLSGSISTSGGLTKAGPGTLTLTASNTYTGSTTVGAGTLVFSNDSNLGTPPTLPTANSIQLSNCVLNITGTTTIAANRGIALLGNASLSNGSTVRYNGVITDNSAGKYLVKGGSGALVLGNAASNYGTLSIITGQVNLGAENGLGNVNLQLGFSSVSNIKTFDLSNFSTPGVAFDQTVNNLNLSLSEATPSHAIITNTVISGSPVTFTDNNAVANTWPGLIQGNLILGKSNVGTLTLTGANSYYGGTSITGGVLSVSSDNNLGDSGVAAGVLLNGGTLLSTSPGLSVARPLTVGVNGGTLDIGSNNYDDSTGNGAVGITGTGVFNKYGTGKLTVTTVRTGGLAVAAGNVTVTPGRDTTNKTSAVTTLSVASGASLDLGDNDLVENYTNVSNPSGADAAQSTAIRTLLANAFNGGAWNGTGGITSNAAATAASSTARTALGYSEASAVGITGTYNGQAVDGNTIVVRYTYSADADLDGTVGSSDFDLLAANFGKTGEFWNNGDFNYDGIVNALDFNALATNYGQNAPLASSPADSQPMAMGALVPEPASIGLLLVAGSSLLARRRR